MYQPTCRQNEGVVLDASFYLLAASRGDTGRFTLPVGCIKEVALDASAYLLSPSKSWYLTLQPTYHVSGIKGEALDASGCIKGWYWILQPTFWLHQRVGTWYFSLTVSNIKGTPLDATAYLLSASKMWYLDVAANLSLASRWWYLVLQPASKECSRILQPTYQQHQKDGTGRGRTVAERPHDAHISCIE